MKLFIFSMVFLFTPFVFATSPKGDVVIINSNKNQSQTVTAPALTPSKASELRKAREDAEISTESHIMEKLEAERLKDEQKRVDKLMGGSQVPGPVVVEERKSLAPQKPQWRFGEKVFISLGGGYVNYLGGDNIDSTAWPAFFLSLGGYARDRFIFDFTGYYSTHFISKYNIGDWKVQQVSGALSVKFSPLVGRLKPYVGAVGSYSGRRYKPTTSSGEVIEDPVKKRGRREWQQAFDAGPALGVDVALGPRLGFNVNLWWLFNGYTEESDANIGPDEELLSKKQSVVASASVRFYF